MHHFQALLVVTKCRKLVCRKIFFLHKNAIRKCKRKEATSENLLNGLNLNDIQKKKTKAKPNQTSLQKKNLTFEAVKAGGVMNARC